VGACNRKSSRSYTETSMRVQNSRNHPCVITDRIRALITTWSTYTSRDKKQHAALNCVGRAPCRLEQHIQCSRFKSFLDHRKTILWNGYVFICTLKETRYECHKINHAIEGRYEQQSYIKVWACSENGCRCEEMQTTKKSSRLVHNMQLIKFFHVIYNKMYKNTSLFMQSLGKCHS
jgi:hypothetical protein